MPQCDGRTDKADEARLSFSFTASRNTKKVLHTLRFAVSR